MILQHLRVQDSFPDAPLIWVCCVQDIAFARRRPHTQKPLPLNHLLVVESVETRVHVLVLKVTQLIVLCIGIE
jgi:hypothetical protein